MAYQKTTTIPFLFTSIFLFLFFISAVSDSQPIYTPNDDIVLDCGSPGTSILNGDPRPWIGDVSSKFFPSQFSNNSASLPSLAEKQPSSVAVVPYLTARLSRSQFTYSFPLNPGQKFIRLYFYPASYPSNFDRYKAVFSVKAGNYTLLRDFNASVNADASGFETIFKEFCMYVDSKLDITFTPTNHSDSYAFVSGIEIVSMPINLYYTPPQPDREGVPLIGQENQFFKIENYTTMEKVYRINIGGNAISPSGDTGMFRTWSIEDPSLLYDIKEHALPLNTSIHLNFSLIKEYTAPGDVYRTARSMGQNATLNRSYNLTWKFPVDPGFYYLLRLHFCEIEPTITSPSDKVFLIYIRDLIAEKAADVFRWTKGRGIPCYRDYVVSMISSSYDNLSVKLQPYPKVGDTKWSNVILNGIEIFKLNNSDGSLAGRNPDPPSITTTTNQSPLLQQSNDNSKTKRLAIVISLAVGGVILFCMVVMFILRSFVFRRVRRYKHRALDERMSRWAPFSFSTNKSSKTRGSTLPSDLCRYFSLSEIKAATKDFDDVFIIGVGGFGNVYKGYIDDGATQVAIKRLKPGSKQGAHEFKTEIEMLSQLRHLHLVSLIGYCNDGDEMILVYDYMSQGTLRSHLYDSDEPPISWKQRLEICIGAARGLHYLHTGAKHTIIHRDVKTTNILLDDKWVAKVSDFGLSKVGPTSMSKAHVSTVVKGSFGYLDPEYYRRQQLTEKSDVYSFGVVLWEILCARPPLIRTADKKQTSLVEWVQRCKRDETLNQIIDPHIKDEISPVCLKKFIEIAMSCIDDEGIKRPAMNDVVWSLEFASQLQDSSKKEVEDLNKAGDEKKIVEASLLNYDTTGFSSNESKQSCFTSNDGTTTTNGDASSFGNAQGMLGTGTVFSEIFEPKAR